MSDDAPPTAASDEAPAPEPQALPKGETPAPTPEPFGKGAEPAASPDASPDVTAPAEGPYRTAAPRSVPPAYRPNYVFLAVVSVVSLVLDLGSKAWAKDRLELPPCMSKDAISIVQDHLSFRFACNQGGAWGLLQNEPESIRRPFFLGISFLAIAFIVSLYRKLTPPQWALKWGLPLVLGGALGNLVNRIQYNHVVDFIVYRAKWVKALNGLLSPHPGEEWPTFNIADVAIVAGVILMAVDMFTPRKSPAKPVENTATAAAPAASTPETGEPVPSPGEPAPTPKET
jgi:signal peptidase II